jgi:hypothetical protein
MDGRMETFVVKIVSNVVKVEITSPRVKYAISALFIP